MKAILVVDIPDGIFIDDCKIEYRVIENVFNMCVADGIKRLKPMPERKHESRPMYGGSKDFIVGVRIDEHAKGWNDCINKILGGDK